MKLKFTLLLWLFALLLTPLGQVQGQDERTDLLNRVNALRASLGIPAYTWNAALAAAAQEQAQWIVDNGDVTHVHPDGSSPRSRAAAAGYATSNISENIYGGTMAGPDDAWTFWINSPIHYQGLTSTWTTEIGVGAAHGGWGGAFVLVFGNPGGYVPAASQNNNSASNDNAQPAAPEQPSYVVGVDEHGNIEHQVQPGDTLGDILLLYGYTWDDLPYIMQLNGLTDVRELKEGMILLIPPKDGTYTPTPGGAPPSETPTPTEESSTQTPSSDLGILTATPTQVVMIAAIATSASVPEGLTTPTMNPTIVAAVATKAAELAAVPSASAPLTTADSNPPQRSGGMSPWLVVALVVQVGVLLGAGYEFIRRFRARR